MKQNVGMSDVRKEIHMKKERERERESQVELERECVEEGCDSFLTWTSYMLVDNSSG